MNAETAGPTPLGVYVHWPYCARLCPYCDFNIYKDKGGDQKLVDSIIADINEHAVRMEKRPARSVHFGGGTPSLLSPQSLQTIIGAVGGAFGLADDAEIALEANPDGFTPQRAAEFRAAGINRLSLGVQSFDDTALRALGRTHDRAQAFAAIDAAQGIFDGVSIDLIYARQSQTIADWRAELQEAAQTGVRHISPYQLTIEEGTAFDRSYRRGALQTPGVDLAADFYEATQDVLGAAGLPAYEISNHAASAADQSQHNLLYWRSHDWVGVGPGAHGRVSIDDARLATEARALPADYIATVSRDGVGWTEPTRLSMEERRDEGILMGVRVAEGLELMRWSADPDKVALFVTEGLAHIEDARFKLTLKGRLLADRIGAELCG